LTLKERLLACSHVAAHNKPSHQCEDHTCERFKFLSYCRSRQQRSTLALEARAAQNVVNGCPNNYAYGYGSPYNYAAAAATAPLVTGRSVATGQMGMTCSTPIKACELYHASWVGNGCSCRVPGGRARGAVTAPLAAAPPIAAAAATAPLMTGRSVATAGNYCTTPAKTCLLYHSSWVGNGCSCRMPGGRERGSVTPQ
jgi:hypothetical protein